MDPQVGSSFIPKKPLVDVPRSGSGGLFLSLGLLLFLLSVGAAGGTFAYQGYLTAAIASKDESLQRTEDAFDLDVIENLVRTDKRIVEIQELLAKHTAPSAIFTLLGELTLSSVRFKQFDYGGDPAGKAVVKLTGTADSFSSVALQSDQFGASKHLSDVVFSGITITSTGQVDFTVEAVVAPATLSYARQIRDGVSSGGAGGSAPAPETPIPPTPEPPPPPPPVTPL